LRFWDSSAIVPTLLEERSSPAVRDLLRSDPDVAVWWSTPVECIGAISRRERSGDLPPANVEGALASLAELEASWIECPPLEPVRALALRVVRIHDVRTADAFQIAAAAMLAESRPTSLPFVTLDDRLATAARREGFRVLP
jgi:hypothetical protein